MKRWEYKTESDRWLGQFKLNEYGDGWELVSHGVATTGGMFPLQRHFYTFKREMNGV